MDGERPSAPSGECLRQRHPGFVPIVCLGDAAGGACERPVRLKLVVRATYTISQLKRDISWRLPEAPVDRLWLGRELAQDDAEVVSAVDVRQRAEDGCLYAQLGGDLPDVEPGEPEDRGTECGGLATFHLPDRDEDDVGTCGGSSIWDGDNVADRLREKHPGRLPVVCKQAPIPGRLPGIKTKLLVPHTMLCGQVKSFVYRRLDPPGMPADVWAGIGLFVADGVQLLPEEPISAAFERHIGEDGLLHLAYGADAAEALAQLAAAEAPGGDEAGEHSLQVSASELEQARHAGACELEVARRTSACELEQVKAEGLAAIQQAFKEGLAEASREASRAACAEAARDAAAAGLRQRERQMADIAAVLRPLAGTGAQGAVGSCLHADGDAIVEQVRSRAAELLESRKSRAALEQSLREALARAEVAESRATALTAAARSANGASPADKAVAG